METQITILALIIGLLVRLVVPIGITILVVYILRRLDERWKRQAEGVSVSEMQARNIGCWDINKCSPENRSRCTAYAHPDKPCWQVFRQADGHLQERCLGCKIFRRSPVPVPA